MAAARSSALHCIATDREEGVLARAREIIAVNDLRAEVEVRRLDWDNWDLESAPWMKAEVVLASDVIYGTAMLPGLIRTIRMACREGGEVAVATRDGRRGVVEFLEAMANMADFDGVGTVVCKESGGVGEGVARWEGSHTVHLFRRRTKCEMEAAGAV